MAMKMNGVMIHRGGVANADADAVSNLCHNWFSSRKRFAIKSEDIELSHLVWIWPTSANIDAPFAEHESEVAVRSRACRVARMNDEHSHCPERHLRHLIVMGVIHVSAVL